MSAGSLKLERATLFVQTPGGVERREVFDLFVALRPWNGYPAAVFYSYEPRGRRVRVELVQAHEPSLVVFAGWTVSLRRAGRVSGGKRSLAHRGSYRERRG